jgi:pimeloyl-ACP methyl ester carboxylesterase
MQLARISLRMLLFTLVLAVPAVGSAQVATERFVDLPGVRLWVKDTGGSGQPLVLLHAPAAMTARIQQPGFAALPAEFRELSVGYRASNPEGTKRWMAVEHESAQEPRLIQPMRSPQDGAKIATIKTPTLVIANELDFRVPVDQGLQMFTVLRRNGVPSETLVFPDEGHWVLKALNSRTWHEAVFGWMKKYLNP